jgi:hypothetical protein
VDLAIPIGESVYAIVDLLIGNMVSNNVSLFGFSSEGYYACAIAIKIFSRIRNLIIISNSPRSLST